MSSHLPKWMEEDRKYQLERDLAQYKKEMDERYPQALWEHARKRTQYLKKEHAITFFKHIGILIVAEIIIVNAFDGFIAGVLATIAFFIYVFMFNYHTKNEPDWDRLNLPQFNGHSRKGYHGPGGVFDEQETVHEIFQGIQAGSNSAGG
ncbi:MAG: hypothetical protein K8I04_10855 [Gammaproteobacteria bacterium]|nr:hypothetical protein [Gammaproteobacteria bacterium]